MRLLRTELIKARAYRSPMVCILAALGLCLLWNLYVLTHVSSPGAYYGASLDVLVLVMRVAWFALPLLLVSGDVVDGTLRPALLAHPHPRQILLAKWGTGLILGAASATAGWTMSVAPTLIWGGSPALLHVALPMLPRLLVVSAMGITTSFALFILLGLRHMPWILLVLLVWAQFIEKLLFSSLPATISPWFSPFNTAQLWMASTWHTFDPSTAYLDQWGIAPLAILTLLLALPATLAVLRFQDRSGRPWGRLRGRHSRVEQAGGPRPTAARDAQAGPSAPAASPVPATRATGASQVEQAPASGSRSLLGQALRWARTIPVKAGLRALLVTMILIPALLTAATTLYLPTMGPVELTADGWFADSQEVWAFSLGVFSMVGFLVVALGGAWIHLREVRSRELAVVYAAIPRRSAVILGSTAVAAALAAVSSVLSLATGLIIMSLQTGVGPGTVLSTPGMMRVVIALPVGTALIQVLVIALAVLIRRPAMAIALITAWFLMVEPLLSLLPVVGSRLSTLAPGSNYAALLGDSTSSGISSSPLLGAAWLAALALVALAAALVVERRRPASIPL